MFRVEPHRTHPARGRVAIRRGWLAVALAAVALTTAPRRALGAEIVSEARIRTARITGDLEASARFATAAKGKQADFLRCYRTQLAKDVGVAGLLPLIVKIDPTGKAGEIAVGPTRLPKELVACTRQALATWQLAGWKVPHRVHAELDIIFQQKTAPAASATIKGGVPADVIAGTIEARLPGLREGCWTGDPPKTSPLINLVVDYDGKQQSSDVTGRFPKATVRTCLQKRLRLWDFPPPDNGHRTWVYYPLFPAPSPGTPQAPRDAPPARGTR